MRRVGCFSVCRKPRDLLPTEGRSHEQQYLAGHSEPVTGHEKSLALRVTSDSLWKFFSPSKPLPMLKFVASGRDPFHQNSDRSDRKKRTTSKGGPVFSKLFRLDRTDPLSFGPKFPESLVEWIAPKTLLHWFKRSWFVICGFRSVLCVSLFQVSLLLIVIMIDGSDKHNCEGGF